MEKINPKLGKLARYSTPDSFVLMQEQTLRDLLVMNPLPSLQELDLEISRTAQYFGTPIVLYAGIPLHKWELVEHRTGEIQMSGSIYSEE